MFANSTKKKNSHLPSSEREKIERDIAVTDEKRDEIVYGLYGISEEKRRSNSWYWVSFGF
jgi:hypothetical protein